MFIAAQNRTIFRVILHWRSYIDISLLPREDCQIALKFRATANIPNTSIAIEEFEATSVCSSFSKYDVLIVISASILVFQPDRFSFEAVQRKLPETISTEKKKRKLQKSCPTR